MIDFIYQVVYPFTNDTNNLVEIANVGVGTYLMRISMRFNNNTINDDPDTNSIFKGIHKTYNLGTSLTKKSVTIELMEDLNMKYRACDLYNQVILNFFII